VCVCTCVNNPSTSVCLEKLDNTGFLLDSSHLLSDTCRVTLASSQHGQLPNSACLSDAWRGGCFNTSFGGAVKLEAPLDRRHGEEVEINRMKNSVY
jgi:hypothetical protein